jgi:hypothetical protein
MVLQVGNESGIAVEKPVIPNNKILKVDACVNELLTPKRPASPSKSKMSKDVS